MVEVSFTDDIKAQNNSVCHFSSIFPQWRRATVDIPSYFARSNATQMPFTRSLSSVSCAVMYNDAALTSRAARFGRCLQ